MNKEQLITIGWREWASLPELGIPAIKVKVDTGAKTSSLHAFEIYPFQKGGKNYVRFKIHPNQGDHENFILCKAILLDQRQVTDSGGHKELRYVIETHFVLGDKTWPIEVTLTDRKNMRFRMLLGRRAMVGHALVDPSASYLYGSH